MPSSGDKQISSPATPVTPATERILDRKVGSRALPSRFSSNLGNKGSEPGKNYSGRSVRAIVDWLEKTSTTTSKKSPEINGSGKTKVSYGLKKDELTEAESSPPEPQSPQVADISAEHSSPIQFGRSVNQGNEDYSLTLLKFKSYFNERPLARCLDRKDEISTSLVKAKQLPKGSEIAKQIATQKHSGGKQSGGQKLDDLMQELESLATETENGVAVERRDPAEVEYFWKSARAGLQIDDDEIYGDCPKKTKPSRSSTESAAMKADQTEAYDAEASSLYGSSMQSGCSPSLPTSQRVLESASPLLANSSESPSGSTNHGTQRITSLQGAQQRSPSPPSPPDDFFAARGMYHEPELPPTQNLPPLPPAAGSRKTTPAELPARTRPSLERTMQTTDNSDDNNNNVNSFLAKWPAAVATTTTKTAAATTPREPRSAYPSRAPSPSQRGRPHKASVASRASTRVSSSGGGTGTKSIDERLSELDDFLEPLSAKVVMEEQEEGEEDVSKEESYLYESPLQRAVTRKQLKNATNGFTFKEGNSLACVESQETSTVPKAVDELDKVLVETRAAPEERGAGRHLLRRTKPKWTSSISEESFENGSVKTEGQHGPWWVNAPPEGNWI